jgi:hypothetical protein
VPGKPPGRQGEIAPRRRQIQDPGKPQPHRASRIREDVTSRTAESADMCGNRRLGQSEFGKEAVQREPFASSVELDLSGRRPDHGFH